jgi:hypothetical protein
LQAVAEPLVVFALVVEGRRTHVVELLIQVLPLVLMQAGGGGRDGREGERGVHELVGELRKIALGRAASGGDQGRHDENDYRPKMAHGLIGKAWRTGVRRPVPACSYRNSRMACIT